jgi:hypothetical protein
MQLAHLEKLTRTRLDDVLVEEGALDRWQVEEAQAEQERTGKPLGEVLVTREMLPDYDLAKLVVTHYPLPFLDLTGYTTRREIMALLPEDFCLRNGVLPLDQFGDVLTIAVCEVPSMELLEDIVTRTKLTPSLFVVVRRALLEAIGAATKQRSTTVVAKRATMIGAVPKPAPAAPASAAVDTVEETSAPEEEESDVPLPDLVLPRVSMALVGGAPGATKSPPPPARPGSRSSIVARPAQSADRPPAPAGGLRWMDSDKPNGAAPRPKTAAPVPTTPPKNGAWESIFDKGEAVVKRETTAGGKPLK